MRIAHQNVPLVELPGIGAGTMLAAVPPSEVPGAPVPTPERESPGMTLDRWLFDKLFGRR